MTPSLARSIALVLALALPAAAAAQPYALGTGSEAEIGCFGPCACPVLVASPLKGGFSLVFTGFDGLFQHYDVGDFKGTATVHDTAWTWVGAGTYEVGGEVAIEQRMTLALSLNGALPRTWDSGLVPGGGAFPAIQVELRLDPAACFDTAVVVSASPANADSPPAPGDPAAMRVSPNPARGRVEVAFALDSPVRGALVVLDVSGARVRTLDPGPAFAPGSYVRAWDGSCDDGRRAAHGVYFIALLDGTRATRRAVVLL